MTTIENIEQALDADWVNLRQARERAIARKAELEQVLGSLAPDDTSIVVFGSVARDELTEGSDIDWTLLLDGPSTAQHFDASLNIKDALDKEKEKAPGRQGTFEGLAFSHSILHRIGGNEDSNRNTTQRILLILESCAIGRAEAYNRVIKNVLKRYILEDYGWMHQSVTVPRFLQNDISRYWRTVAVDFAYKRRQRRGEGWALRTIKLRMSRKLTYASGLLTCFSVPEAGLPKGGDNGSETELAFPVVGYLSKFLQRTPLEIMAEFLLPHEQLHSAASRIFSRYNEFIGMLNNPEKRSHLEELAPRDAETNTMY